MAVPVTSFKKFLKKRKPVILATLPHKVSTGMSASAKARDTEQPAREYIAQRQAKGKMQAEESQLDELAKTPMNSSEPDKLHKRLSKFYNLDDKDKEGVQLFSKFGSHFNRHFSQAAMPEEEKSKPDPKDAEKEKYTKEVDAAGKVIDQQLSAHKSPSASFHVYAGLRGHPFDSLADTTGYEKPEGEEPVEAMLPGFTQASIDPNYAKNNAGKEGHVLKMEIPPGSKHGAYVSHANGNEGAKEFLMRPGRKLRIHPTPEKHGEHTIWHGELQGDK